GRVHGHTGGRAALSCRRGVCHPAGVDGYANCAGEPVTETLQPRRLSSKAVRFAAVGIANSGIDFAVFTALAWAGIPALIANVLAWAVAVTFSYAVNSRWTFEADEALGKQKSFIRFALSGAAISLGSSSLALVAL